MALFFVVYLFLRAQLSRAIPAQEANKQAVLWGPPACKDIEGAVARNSAKYPSCKCGRSNAKVFCRGDQVSEKREFNADDVWSNPNCLRPMCHDKFVCSLIVGAEHQSKAMFTKHDWPKCQCVSKEHRVFCSTTEVAPRLFNGSEVLSNLACSNPICAEGPSCEEIEGAEPQQGNKYPNCKCKKHLHSVQCKQTVSVHHADQGFNAAIQVWDKKECGRPRCEMAGANCTQQFNYRDVQLYIDQNEQAIDSDDPLAQFASLSNRINNLFSPVAGWALELDWNTGEERECGYVERVGIYTRDQKCALVFSSFGAGATGKTLFADGTTQLPTTTEWCEIQGVLEGYANRLNDFVWGSRFQEFKDFLNDETKCSSGVIGVGHSMGGGLVSLMATCANKYPEKYWKTDELYTFAAPAVTYEHRLENALDETFPVENGTQQRGCFKGLRVYSEDQYKVDPIPALSTKFNFKHPMLREYRITELANGSYTREEEACNSAHAATHPEWNFFSRKSAVAGGVLHPATVYIKRILALAGIVRSPTHD